MYDNYLLALQNLRDLQFLEQLGPLGDALYGGVKKMLQRMRGDLVKLEFVGLQYDIYVDNVKHRLNPTDEQSYNDENWHTFYGAPLGGKFFGYGPGVHEDGHTVDFVW